MPTPRNDFVTVTKYCLGRSLSTILICKFRGILSFYNFISIYMGVLFWYVSSEEFYNICKLTAIFCSQKNSSIRHHNRRDVTHYHHNHVAQCFASNCNLFSETGKALATSWTCTGAKFYWPIKVSLVNVDNYVQRCNNQSQCHRCQCQ